MNAEDSFTLKKCCEFIDNKTKQEIIELQNKILTALNFEVYPEPENIEHNKRNYDIWKDSFLNSNGNKHYLIIPNISQCEFDKLYNELKNKHKHPI
jgi:hypothetical protein